MYPYVHDNSSVLSINNLYNTVYPVKKVSGFPVPSQDVTYQTHSGQEYFKYDVIIPAQGVFGK